MSGIGTFGLFLLFLQPRDEERLVQIGDPLIVGAKEVIRVRNGITIVGLERRARREAPVNIICKIVRFQLTQTIKPASSHHTRLLPLTDFVSFVVVSG